MSGQFLIDSESNIEAALARMDSKDVEMPSGQGEMDHSQMDHGEPDESQVDHSQMEHQQ